MEEKNLTNEEIVQALECCVKEEHKDCPHCGEFVSQFDCMRNAISNALDLIHRLQADNIQFKWNYVELKERYVKVLDLNEKVIAEQKDEIERLTEEKWKVQDDLDNYHAMLKESEKKNYELQKQVDELREEKRLKELQNG